MAKWKRGGLQNRYAGVQFPLGSQRASGLVVKRPAAFWATSSLVERLSDK